MIRTETAQIAQELEQTVVAIFQQMMGLDAVAYETNRTPEANRLVATIHYSGTWNGVLLFEVDPPHACRLTGSFLSSETPDTVNDDVRDVIGELANMIGGNLKASLAPGALLSTPEVFGGNDLCLRIRHIRSLTRQAFRCDGGVFSVSLIETSPAVSDH